MFTFYKAKERGRRRRRRGRPRRPPPSQYASLSTLNVLFYVLCRVRVRFCWFELSFVGGGFRLIHLLSTVTCVARAGRRALPGSRRRCVCVDVRAGSTRLRRRAVPGSWSDTWATPTSRPQRPAAVLVNYTGREPIDPLPLSTPAEPPQPFIYYSTELMF